MDEKTTDVFNFYDIENKDSFFPAYLYMKFLHHFIAKFPQKRGMPVNPKIARLDNPDLDLMLQAYADMVVECGSSAETSIYHSKVVKLPDAKKLITQNIDMHLQVPETILPFPSAREILLINPDAIAVGVCPCRLAKPECNCMPEPMEACIFIGDPHVSFLVENNPMFRRVSQEEAVHILEDCHKRGFVHCAYFKKDFGRRLYAICNCCSCCCLGVQARNAFNDGLIDHTVAEIVPSGYVAKVGEDCVGCGECLDTCQFHAISMAENEECAIVDFDKCMGCGVCGSQCPTQAITLSEELSKGGVLDLDELKKKQVSPEC